jgi:predicted ATP-dependent serine protease
MARAITIKNILNKKHKTYQFVGIFKKILGNASTAGIWLIYGKDKNGKTWAALLIAQLLSLFDKVLYVSAEQGIDSDFQEAIIRAKIDPNNKKLQFWEYEPISEIESRLKMRNPPKIVFIDNLSMYKGEITAAHVKQLVVNHPKTHFVLLAHEERNQPYTAAAMMAKKLAKVIFHVQGLAIHVSGRCPGGTLIIDQEKAMLFHGEKIAKDGNL